MLLNTVNDLSWSDVASIPEAMVPPLAVVRGTPLTKIRGSEGDIIVIRISNSSHLDPAKRATLRSLNLAEIGSSALWKSNSPTTMGMIRSVKDHVAVVELGRVISLGEVVRPLSQDPYPIERLQYGSRTRPGELVRSVSGDYFAFESDRRNFRLMWGTSQGLERCLSIFLETFPHLRPSKKPQGSTLITVGSDDIGVREASAGEIMRLAREVDNASFVSIDFSEGFDFFWNGPHQPFDDMDVVCNEVGLGGANEKLGMNLAAQFANATANPAFFEAAECRVAIRVSGKLRVIPFGERP